MALLTVFETVAGSKERIRKHERSARRIIAEFRTQLDRGAMLDWVDARHITMRRVYLSDSLRSSQPPRVERTLRYECTRQGDNDVGFVELLTMLAGMRPVLERRGDMQMSSTSDHALQEIARAVLAGRRI